MTLIVEGCPKPETPIRERAWTDEQRLREVIAWFAGDDTGMSSEAIACHMTGVESRNPWCAPSDPGDLGRCLRLLERFPEWNGRMGEMAKHGPEWAALVPHWGELEKLMADEVGIDWSKGRIAPITYATMKTYLAEGATP